MKIIIGILFKPIIVKENSSKKMVILLEVLLILYYIIFVILCWFIFVIQLVIDVEKKYGNFDSD
jgi:hypothetical protein